MSDLSWFSDEQWARIEPMLPKNTRGLKRVDDRRVLSGIVHVLKSGGRWVDCPADYGPKKTIIASSDGPSAASGKTSSRASQGAAKMPRG